MSFISDFLENKLVEHVFRANTFVSPAGVYVGLFTGNPGEDGNGPELIGNGYARKQASFAIPVDGVALNDADVIFDPATSNWATVTHLAIYDAPTGGHVLFYGALSAPITISSGNNFRLPTGNLAVGFD